MIINYNNQFRSLLSAFDLSDSFDFDIRLPDEIQRILDDKIIEDGNGITLVSFGKLYKAHEDWENQSIIEDNENHFHVSSFTENPNPKSVFMLSIKVLNLLAQKFRDACFSDIRFWLSFQTPELAKEFEIINNIYEENTEQFISDRISFHRIRNNEEIISPEKENHYYAILIIDI